jgi:predicted MFS family arabinose efflux permease
MLDLAPLRKNREFVLLLTGEIGSAIGTQTSAIAYPLLALAISGSPATAGALGFARALPWVLFSLPAGALVDRLDRRRIMLACDVVALGMMASVAIVLALGQLRLPHLFAAGFVEGGAYVFLHLCYAGAMKQLVAQEQLPDAVAYSAARESVAHLVGPPVGGALYGVSRSLPFVTNAVSYLVSLASLLLIRTPFQEARPQRPGQILTEVREGLTWLWRQPFLRTSLLLVGAGNFYTNAVGFTLIVVARGNGASSALIGAMLAVLAAGGILGVTAAPFLRRRVGARTIVVGYSWVAAAVVVPIVLTSHPIAWGVIFAVLVFLGPTWNAIVDGYRISITPDRLQGRVSSADNLIAFSAIPLGPLIAGVLLETFSGDTALLALGCFMLAIAVIGNMSRSLRGPLTPEASAKQPDQRASGHDEERGRNNFASDQLGAPKEKRREQDGPE